MLFSRRGQFPIMAKGNLSLIYKSATLTLTEADVRNEIILFSYGMPNSFD